jgi:hypothetical protein
MPEHESVVEKATGENGKNLLWMVAGATVLLILVAPHVKKWIGVSIELALVISGFALAYLGRGSWRKAGQGAVVTGIAAFAASTFGPMIARFNPFGGKSAAGALDGNTGSGAANAGAGMTWV